MFHRNLYFTSPSFLYWGGWKEKKNEKKINPNDIWLVSSEVKASHVENRVGTAVWGRKTGWASSSPGCNYLLKTKQNKKKCTCEYTPLKTDIYLTSEVPTFGFTMAELTVLFGGFCSISVWPHSTGGLKQRCKIPQKKQGTSHENGPCLWSQAPLPSTTAP